jgi:hypothetical protein
MASRKYCSFQKLKPRIVQSNSMTFLSPSFAYVITSFRERVTDREQAYPDFMDIFRPNSKIPKRK